MFNRHNRRQSLCKEKKLDADMLALTVKMFQQCQSFTMLCGLFDSWLCFVLWLILYKIKMELVEISADLVAMESAFVRLFFFGGVI